jgi:phosphatidylserine/phosphatidylglycerophosphate/cardiolipin synthase-like enzyme
MRSALQWYADLYRTHDVKPLFVTDYTKLLTDASVALLEREAMIDDGRAAMWSAYAGMPNLTGSTKRPTMNIGVVSLPIGSGGSKGGKSRASLHSKAVIIDQRLAVIGSMNLDLRSQLKNSEVGLLIRSTALSQQATRQIEDTLATAAYRVEERDGKLHWRAPAGASFADESSEPGASTKLKLLVRVLGPFAPDEML